VPPSCAQLGGFAIGALHGFRCHDNVQVCKLIALYTANVYNYTVPCPVITILHLAGINGL